MDFLKSLLLKEARMKDAAMDLVYKAAEAVPKTDDQEKYLMKVVAKVLSLDKDKLFKGDAVQAEKMVKQVLGESVVVEGDVIPFPKKKVAPPAAKATPAKTTAKTGPKDVWAKAEDKDYPLTERGLYKLLNDLDEDARGATDYLSKDARYKEINVRWHSREVEWVTQETHSDYQNVDAAKQIAKVMKKAGFTGITVKVAVRDNWNGDKTPWKKAKS